MLRDEQGILNTIDNRDAREENPIQTSVESKHKNLIVIQYLLKIYDVSYCCKKSIKKYTLYIFFFKYKT